MQPTQEEHERGMKHLEELFTNKQFPTESRCWWPLTFRGGLNQRQRRKRARWAGRRVK